MRPKTLQQAAMKRALDLAGGVTFLSNKVGVSAYALDAMLSGTEEIPMWLFLRVVDYINEAEAAGVDVIPGTPGDGPSGKELY
jgi:hypothetical protein